MSFISNQKEDRVMTLTLHMEDQSRNHKAKTQSKQCSARLMQLTILTARGPKEFSFK